MKISDSILAEKATLSHPSYRADIDGLRAIAVLSVVGFHAFPNWIKGGFVGVDIFFVISGFLISSVIFSGLINETFSFREFYARRIRRIFPSLIVVLIGTYVIGWIVMFPDEYKNFGEQIAAGAGFLSNFFLWHESGYFDSTSETKPLLHLWSLGIEEQFYIVWPLLLWLAWKRRLNLLTVTIVTGVISFTLNLHVMQLDTVAAFYLPQTRFWELLAGSVLAYITLYKPTIFVKIERKLEKRLGITFNSHVLNNTLRDGKSLLGTTLIAASIFLLTKSDYFPGWLAMLPTVGTVLIISAGAKAWLNRAVLSNHVLVWFGLISFPLYLWHWPLLSFARIIEYGTPSRTIRIGVVLASIVLAWTTYRFIERYIRFRKSRIVVITLCLLMIGIGYLGYNTYKRDGLLFRTINHRIALLTESSKRTNREKECFDIANAHDQPDAWFCHMNKKSNNVRAFVFGDSHALSLLPTFEVIAQRNNVDILLTGFSGCPPLLGVYVTRRGQQIRNCRQLNERVLQYVTENHITDVFLVARWSYYTDGGYADENLSSIELHPGPWQIYPSLRQTKASSREAFQHGLVETVSRYARAGIHLHIVKDIPLQLQNTKDLFRKLVRSSFEHEAAIHAFSVRKKQHEALQAFVNEQIDNQKSPNGLMDTIDLDSVYCRDMVCPFASGGTAYYFDADHLSVFGALLAVDILQMRFDESRKSSTRIGQ